MQASFSHMTINPNVNIDDHSTFEKQSSKPNETKKFVCNSLYLGLEKIFDEQGKDFGVLLDFFIDISPILEKLSNNPEITEAILSGKFDAELAKAVLEGKVRIEDKTTVAKTNEEVKKSCILPK